MSWIPLALSRDIPKGATRAIILAGKELVAWRGEEGTIQIWEDRCPHRGMRLSFGFIRGNALNCLYHGWQYDAGSRCMKIPAHPDLEVPPTIKAKAFEASESGGLILLNPGAPEPPPIVLAGLPVASMAVMAGKERLLALAGGRQLTELQAVETTLEGVPMTIGWHEVDPQHLMLHVIARDAGTESNALRALHRLRSAAEKVAA